RSGDSVSAALTVSRIRWAESSRPIWLGLTPSLCFCTTILRSSSTITTRSDVPPPSMPIKYIFTGTPATAGLKAGQIPCDPLPDAVFHSRSGWLFRPRQTESSRDRLYPALAGYIRHEPVAGRRSPVLQHASSACHNLRPQNWLQWSHEYRQ